MLLEEGKDISLPRVVEHLTRVGYRRADLAIETGDLAVRGGLFDVFPPDRDLPLRVELDGDRIASLRVFDPDTQRSRERLKVALIPPFAATEDAQEARALLEDRIGRPPSEAERIVFARGRRADARGVAGSRAVRGRRYHRAVRGGGGAGRLCRTGRVGP